MPSNLGCTGVGGGSKGRDLEEGSRGGLGMAWGNGRGEGGRMVVGAGRFISQLREPF